MKVIETSFFTLSTDAVNSRLSIVQTIVEYIKGLIIKGELSDGDKIPTEPELCSILSVGRGSVREAIKVLEALGVLEIRRGNGTYISAPDTVVISTPLMYKMLLNNVTLNEMLDFRSEIELVVLRLAMHNATENDLKMLHECIEKQSDFLKMQDQCSPLDRYEMEIEFHQLLSQTTNNMIIQELYRFILEVFSTMLKNHYSMGHGWESIVHIHKSMFYAIVHKSEEEAKAIVQKTSDKWYRWMDIAEELSGK